MTASRSASAGTTLPDKPLWTIPNSDNNSESPNAAIGIPDNIIVDDLASKTPIICEECPCATDDGMLSCYFVFESECTDNPVDGTAIWSEPRHTGTVCMRKPLVVEEWFMAEKALARMYVQATRDSIPEDYYDLPWTDGDHDYEYGLADTDPVSCYWDKDICGVLDYTKSYAYEKGIVKKPTFPRCCSANGHTVRLTELSYDTETLNLSGGKQPHTYKAYKERKKEDAIVVASYTTDYMHFADVTIKGKLRGCLIARVIYPVTCSNKNVVEYKIAVGSGAQPSRIRTYHLLEKSYDEKAYGDVDSEVIPVPPGCRLDVLLYCSDEDMGLAESTTYHNKHDTDRSMQRNAYIGCNLAIEWCPYMYWGSGNVKCEQGSDSLPRMPEECEYPSSKDKIRIVKSYNDKVYIESEKRYVHYMEAAEHGFYLNNDKLDAFGDASYDFYCFFNGYAILFLGEYISNRDTLVGRCITSHNEGALKSIVDDVYTSGRAIGTQDYIYVTKGEGKVGIEDPPCQAFAAQNAFNRFAKNPYGNPNSYSVDQLIISSVFKFEGGDGNSPTATFIEPPLVCCGRTFSKILEKWTNNRVLEKHCYDFRRPGNECFHVCYTANVEVRDVGPKGGGSCPARGGKWHSSWGDGDCGEPEYPSQGCSHVSYNSTRGSILGEIPYEPCFESGYCYDGYMEVKAWCDGAPYPESDT